MPTLQKPIGSGIGATSTAGDAIAGIDLSGRVAIVTGGYAGIGLETTRTLLPREDEASAPSQFSLVLRQAGSTPLGVMPYAVDPEAADRLWTLCEQLLGLGQNEAA
jgi:hypothetical protein